MKREEDMKILRCKERKGKYLFLVILIAITYFFTGCSSKEEKAKGLYVESVSYIEKAKKSERDSYEEAYEYFTKSKKCIDKIRKSYKETHIAVEIVSGKSDMLGVRFDQYDEIESKLKRNIDLKRNPMKIELINALRDDKYYKIGKIRNIFIKIGKEEQFSQMMDDVYSFIPDVKGNYYQIAELATLYKEIGYYNKCDELMNKVYENVKDEDENWVKTANVALVFHDNGNNYRYSQLISKAINYIRELDLPYLELSLLQNKFFDNDMQDETNIIYNEIDEDTIYTEYDINNLKSYKAKKYIELGELKKALDIAIQIDDFEIVIEIMGKIENLDYYDNIADYLNTKKSDTVSSLDGIEFTGLLLGYTEMGKRLGFEEYDKSLGIAMQILTGYYQEIENYYNRAIAENSFKGLRESNRNYFEVYARNGKEYYIKIGNLMYESGREEEAIKSINFALLILEKLEDNYSRLKENNENRRNDQLGKLYLNYFDVCKLYCEMGKFDAAEENLNIVYEYITKVTQDKITYDQRKNIYKLFENLTMLEVNYEITGNREKIIEIYNEMDYVSLSKEFLINLTDGRNYEDIKWFTEIITNSKEVDNGEIYILLDMYNEFTEKGDNQSSESMYKDMINFVENIDHEEESNIDALISFYEETHNYDMLEEEIMKIDDTEEKCDELIDLAIYYSENENYNEVIRIIKQVQIFITEFEDYDKSYYYLEFAKLYFKMGMSEETKEMLIEYSKIEDAEINITFIELIGKVYNQEKMDYDKEISLYINRIIYNSKINGEVWVNGS